MNTTLRSPVRLTHVIETPSYKNADPRVQAKLRKYIVRKGSGLVTTSYRLRPHIACPFKSGNSVDLGDGCRTSASTRQIQYT